MSPTEEEQLKAQLIERAWSDPEFKALALKDPRKAVAELGLDAPEEFEITIVADEPGMQHWVIPVESDDELLEADLEAVAGGMSGLGQLGGFVTEEAPESSPLGRMKRHSPDAIDPTS